MNTSKPFTLKYTDRSTGKLCSEKPRLMISVDGSQHSLVVGDNTIIASGDKNITMDELWAKARLNIANM